MAIEPSRGKRMDLNSIFAVHGGQISVVLLPSRAHNRGMNFFTARNLVILALVQIGAITAGVLAAGVSVKWMTEFHLCGPRDELEFICDFGWIALALPMTWAAV